MSESRIQSRARLNTFVLELEPGPIQQFAIAVVYLIDSHFDSYRISLGRWTDQLISELMRKHPIHSTVREKELREYQLVMLSIGRLLAQGVRDLWYVRSTLIWKCLSKSKKKNEFKSARDQLIDERKTAVKSGKK